MHRQKHHAWSVWDLNYVFGEKSCKSNQASCILHFIWENGTLCPIFTYSRAGRKQGERPETCCSLGKQQSQHVHRRTSNSWCSAGKWSILIFSPHSTVDAVDELQFSPKLELPIPQGRTTDTLLSAQACAKRTARSLWVGWSCNMCVLKIQSQLILQDFMLQTLKSLNNNILSAFYVAPVKPEGPKTLQKLCVVVALKKLRNHCLSCLQEAEM